MNNNGKLSRPLDAFPILRSRNIEEVRQTIIGSYRARRLNLAHRAEGFEFRINHWQSKNIGLAYLSGAPFQLEFPSADFFRQAFVRGGAVIKFDRIERPTKNEATCVIPPDVSAAASFAPGFEHFGLKIKTDALLSKLAALIGTTPSRRLVFDPAAGADDPAIGNLRRMLMFFAAELNSAMPALALAELEQALIVSFICSNRHNYSAFLDERTRPIASWQVRRAEEYIEAHWDEPITIEDLARVTSVSARNLFDQFKRGRGQSPMGFVKQVRLQRAREMLESADCGASVTETALACGFGNLGHFARDYYRRFGERPSDTLKRNRGSRQLSTEDIAA